MGEDKSLGTPDVVSLEAIEEGMWNCFMVAGQTMVYSDLENCAQLGLYHFSRGCERIQKVATQILHSESPIMKKLHSGSFNVPRTFSLTSIH